MSPALAETEPEWAKKFYSLLPRAGEIPPADPPAFVVRPGSAIALLTASALDGGRAEYESMRDRMGPAAYGMAVLRARRRGLLDGDVLTQRGRWHGICAVLGVGASELCVLADMYVVSIVLRASFGSKLYKKNPGLEGRLGLGSMKGVYRRLVERGYVRCRWGHGYKYVPETAYLDDCLFGRLHTYMWDLMVLKRALNTGGGG